jgi:hypothetical protein
MVKLNILFKYMVRYTAIFTAIMLLSGCLGGTVAQQIVRSIATSVADKAMARAMDVDEDQPYSNRKPDYSNTPQSNTQAAYAPATQSSSLPQPYQAAKSAANAKQDIAKHNAQQYQLAQRNIQQAQNDPYRIAIANTAFEELKPQDLKPIAEPLPTEFTEVGSATEIIQSSQLVRVELFNLLIGDEKNAVYEQARLMGAASLPQKREWALWRVATGAIQLNQGQPDKKVITFLIPPEFGKLPSGAVTMVELASPGELNVARYKAN